MTTTYALRDIDSDLTGGAFFSKKLLLATAALNSQVISVTANATTESYGFLEAGDPNSNNWTAAGATVEMTSGSTASASLRYSARLDRVSSTGTLLESGPATAEQTLGTNSTITLSPTAPAGGWGTTGAQAQGDRLRVAYIIRNTAGSTQSIRWIFNTANCEVASAIAEDVLAFYAPLVVLEAKKLEPTVSISWSAPLVVLELKKLDPAVQIAWPAPLVVLELNDLDAVVAQQTQRLELNDLDPTVSIAWQAPLVVLELKKLDSTVQIAWPATLPVLGLSQLPPTVSIAWQAPLVTLQLDAQPCMPVRWYLSNRPSPINGGEGPKDFENLLLPEVIDPPHTITYDVQADITEVSFGFTPFGFPGNAQWEEGELVLFVPFGNVTGGGVKFGLRLDRIDPDQTEIENSGFGDELDIVPNTTMRFVVPSKVWSGGSATDLFRLLYIFWNFDGGGATVEIKVNDPEHVFMSAITRPDGLQALQRLEFTAIEPTVTTSATDVVVSPDTEVLELDDLDPSVILSWPGTLHVLALDDLDPTLVNAWPGTLERLELNDLDPSVSIAWTAPLVVLELTALAPTVSIAWAAPLVALELNDLQPDVSLAWPATLERIELRPLETAQAAPDLLRLELNDLDPVVSIAWDAPLVSLALAALGPTTSNAWPATSARLELSALPPAVSIAWPASLPVLALKGLDASNENAWSAPASALSLQPLGLFLAQQCGTLHLLPWEPTVEVVVPIAVDVLAPRGFLRLRPLKIMVLTGQIHALERARVQNALTEAAGAALFPPVHYDADSGQVVIDGLDYSTVRPSITCNEVASRAAPCRLERITPHRRERRRWQFNLHLRFNQEVDLELFEQDLMDNPIVLARDDSIGLRQIVLSLEDSKPEHPPEQAPAGGTRAVLTFEAAFQPS